MALRDTMRDSAARCLKPGEPVQAVIGGRAASRWLAALTGVFVCLRLNRYRLPAVTSCRIPPARCGLKDIEIAEVNVVAAA
jgi:hypothetical protein